MNTAEMTLFQKYGVSYSETKHCLEFVLEKSHVSIILS